MQSLHRPNRPFHPPGPPYFHRPPHFHFPPLPPPPPPHYFQAPHPPPRHHAPHFPRQSPPPPPPSFFRPPAGATPPPAVSPSPPPPPPPQLGNPAAPSTPPPRAGTPGKQDKLDKLLEKLGSRFPECTKVQLTSLLQQVKSSRGTLAGMSMEEVVVQVGLRLAKNESSGPAVQPAQRVPPGGGGGEARRLCLMCQNHVDPEQRHPLGCSHTIHKDCIRTWLETSKNNSCPFCK